MSNPRSKTIHAALARFGRRVELGQIPDPRPVSPKKVARKHPTESQEQAQLCQWLRKHGVLFHSVPNHLSPSTRGLCGKCAAALRRNFQLHVANQKRTGLVSGCFDISIQSPVPSAPHKRVSVEMKTVDRKGQKDGGLSPTQVAWRDKLEAVGEIALVAHGAASAIAQLREIGFGEAEP